MQKKSLLQLKFNCLAFHRWEDEILQEASNLQMSNNRNREDQRQALYLIKMT